MEWELIRLPKAEEWLYFHQGEARATVFLGGALARSFEFRAGDTAVFPDNSGMGDPTIPRMAILMMQVITSRTRQTRSS